MTVSGTWGRERFFAQWYGLCQVARAPGKNLPPMTMQATLLQISVKDIKIRVWLIGKEKGSVTEGAGHETREQSVKEYY